MAVTVNVDGLHHGRLGKPKLLLDRASRLGMQAKGLSIAKRYENQGNFHDGDTMHAAAAKERRRNVPIHRHWLTPRSERYAKASRSHRSYV